MPECLFIFLFRMMSSPRAYSFSFSKDARGLIYLFSFERFPSVYLFFSFRMMSSPRAYLFSLFRMMPEGLFSYQSIVNQGWGEGWGLNPAQKHADGDLEQELNDLEQEH